MQFNRYRPDSVSFNVKSYAWPTPASLRAAAPDTLGAVDDAHMERAGELAWEGACLGFWDYVKDREAGPRSALPAALRSCQVSQDGRSGGWLTLNNLPVNYDTGELPAELLPALAAFEAALQSDIDYLTDPAQLAADIVANCWHHDGAELYNMVDTPCGTMSLHEAEKLRRHAWLVS